MYNSWLRCGFNNEFGLAPGRMFEFLKKIIESSEKELEKIVPPKLALITMASRAGIVDLEMRLLETFV